jgi:TolB-like protein
MVTVVMLLTMGNALSEQTIRLAVFDFQPIGVDPATVLATGQLLRNDLAGPGRFSVVEEGQMQRTLGQTVQCFDSRCAAEHGRRLGAEKAIVGSLSRLGEKIIVELRLVDVTTAQVEYSDRMASSTLEDLDTVIQRLANSVASGKRVESTAEVGLIVQEEAKEPLRRKNFFTVGGKFGYLFPTGQSWGRVDRLLCLDWVTRYETPSFLVESLFGYRFELTKDKGAFDLPIDFSIFYLPSRSDFSPYLGGGLGIHWIGAKNRKDDGSSNDAGNKRTINHGLALNLGGGLMGFRTYDFRIVVDLRYQVVFADVGNEKTHQGIGLTFGITNLRGESNGPRGCCVIPF